MNKCKWEDGVFKPCEWFNGVINQGTYRSKQKYYCESCGKDIKKPELEEPIIIAEETQKNEAGLVGELSLLAKTYNMKLIIESSNKFSIEPEDTIIKKSGETYVARFEGIDYLCVDPISCNGTIRAFEVELSMGGIWCQMSKIIITDEIAKLRPIISVLSEGQNTILWGVDNDKTIYTGIGNYSKVFQFSLCTVDDL